MIQRLSLLVLMASLWTPGAFGAPLAIRSPSGTTEILFRLDDAGTPRYSVRFRGRELLADCALGLRFRSVDLGRGLELDRTHVGSRDQTFEVDLGKNRIVRDRAVEATVSLRQRNAPRRRLDIVLRCYDEGVALHYALPRQEKPDSLELVQELTSFRFPVDPTVHFLPLGGFKTSHEGLYDTSRLTAISPRKLIDLPILLELDEGPAVAITEARLRDWAGLYLRAAGGDTPALESRLSPLPGESEVGGVKVRTSTPCRSPWRVVWLAERAGDLIESDLLLCLNNSCAIEDTSWIRAGKTTWNWWNGTQEEADGTHPGMTFASMAAYIDFCAQSGIEFHAIVADRKPWYRQRRDGYAPGPESDVTVPRPELEWERLLAYAEAKGVGLRLWVHQRALRPKLDEAFALYERWGIEGLMVDFLDRGDQDMVVFCERVVRTAARHRLKIQFHGSYKPTGLRRTYPNLVNKEGVLNLEAVKWSEQPTPEHDVLVPYTRMLAGPMDYHLGGFRAASRQSFRRSHIRPRVPGTRCHQLAMYVVYENPVPMVADEPSAYREQPGFGFLTQIPTTWDETKFLAGAVGDSIALARRRGTTWYIGAMTDWTPREMRVELGFLGKGVFDVEELADANGTVDDPNALERRRRRVESRDELVLRMAAGGGYVARITPDDDLESR